MRKKDSENKLDHTRRASKRSSPVTVSVAETSIPAATGNLYLTIPSQRRISSIIEIIFNNLPSNYTGYGKPIHNYNFDNNFSMNNMPSAGSISQMAQFSSMPSMNGANANRFKSKMGSGKKKIPQGEADFRVKYKTEVKLG